GADRPASKARVFGVVRVSDRLAQTRIEALGIDNHLLGVHGFDGIERDREVAGVLHVDDELAPAVRSDLPHRAERFARPGGEHLEAFLDLLVDHACTPLLSGASGRPVTPALPGNPYHKPFRRD